MKVPDPLTADLILASQLGGSTRILRSLAHDVRAPLNSIVLNLELLRQSLGGADKDQAEACCAILQQEVGRLKDALESLILEARPRSDGETEFDLGELLTHAARLVQPVANLQKVALVTELPEEPTYLNGQRERLQQAILNLAVNALEAMPTGGKLLLSLERQNGKAVVKVADSGGGIAPDLLPRIFDLHVTTKPTRSGIGLFVARAIAEANGGSIAACNRADGGGEFLLRLPVVSAAP